MAEGRLPAISGRQVIEALMRKGFVLDRTIGDHHVLAYPDDPQRTVTVPVHADRNLKPRTLQAIIPQTGLTVKEFVELL